MGRPLHSQSVDHGTSQPLARRQVFGRGALVDSAVNAINDRMLRTELSPKVLVLAGHLGIGRRTLNRPLLQDAFPATPELGFGPEFVLPQFADLADLYRALREELQSNILQGTKVACEGRNRFAEEQIFAILGERQGPSG